MSAPFERRGPAHVAGTGGTLLALDCARNVHAAVDRRMPEARALAGWLAENAAAFGLSDAALPDEWNGFGRSRRGGVAVADWRKVRAALDLAAAALPSLPDAPINHWTAAISNALELDPVAKRVLALALHYGLDKRVERLVDAMSQCRGGMTRLNRDASLFALLLQVSTADAATHLAANAKLLASGLLHLDRHAGLSVQERLVSLIRQDVPPAADFYDQLLGSSQSEPLPWEAFAHLGREAEIAASVLRAALAGKESGVSILLYGPPGTGKTSFAATLAARVGVRLRSVAEADDDGDEPQRHTRLAGLRLAQRLAVAGDTLLLFDEAEDLFVRRDMEFDEPVASSRVFIHRLLERLAVPVIWTANDIGVLGPAVLRRMTMCLELKVPSLATRTRLWRRMGEAEGVVLQDADAARLAPCARGPRCGLRRFAGHAAGGRRGGDRAADRRGRGARRVRRRAAGARAGAGCDLRPGADQRRLRPGHVDRGPAPARRDARRLVPAVGAAGCGQERLGSVFGRADGHAGAAQARLRPAQPVRWRHRAEHRRRLRRGAGGPSLPGVRRGGQPSAGAGGRGAQLGDQPGQRNVDLDGRPCAAVRLHHQPG